MSDLLQDYGAPRRNEAEIVAVVREAAEPLPARIDDPAFGLLVDRFADARVVLLGEASHGTSEFYRARAEITRRLIERHGFTVVALEADWPDAGVFDAYVRHRQAPAGADEAFTRFPTWMWRNREFEAFLQWLRAHNGARPEAQRAGVYGLDLYNLSASMRAVIDYLDREDPEAARTARERYGCLEPWAQEPAHYGRLSVSSGYARCEDPVNSMLREMLERQLSGADGEALLDATQNARLVRDAEAYYRAMYFGGPESWNLRDRHMFDTLASLLEAKGPQAKAVIWAHNSHIGDARATEMGALRDELNIGQLCRERWGERARSIGFGTHCGTVACADDWDEPMQVKTVRPSLSGSCEQLAHQAGERFLLDLRPGVNEALRVALEEPRLERFIGVIYRPETERWSHYVDCRLAEQFDAYVWFDETRAVSALPARMQPHEEGAEETWPFGL